MLFHLSIPAENPERVARVIAEIWKGEALPFPPYAGAYIAMAGDERNTAIEVYPVGFGMVPAAGDDDAELEKLPVKSNSTGTHAAIASPLSEVEILEIAKREKWLTKTLSRGGMFRVIEFWLENAVMLEVLTPEMQAEYLAGMTIGNWRAFAQPQSSMYAA